ncbi:2-oxoisovalerate dehydrogenase E1 component, alpha subunit [Fonticula alba]|uniref:2-oxoisovalerate dehydrogenase subunit alpha n=1 Tax=Fonticula alba TaxID=691883 RepID=A0A058ZGS4_FONAL|nr:2-oxoisovalerate dehydrogenase E1 component, alpha subunit [Fonticula alba]KCV72692.1 2-oxoisovalerate dehydrogenase E1 component, alpha subunit [Fonticula alba]|eukprot:XP_009492393.1 2-oxoisovalerate dehydrogenase E1 component, alpha subunit [Fonticula alba]
MIRAFAQIRSLRPMVAGRALYSSAAAPATSQYPGAIGSPYTKDLAFVDGNAPLPTYRVMDRAGKILDEAQIPAELAGENLVSVYKQMVQLNMMDKILYDAQRQGRISFYMTNYGEEASHFGSAAALTLDDHIFSQYREAGVLMHRGFTLDDFMNQCYSNALDPGKGRQMPVHYGSRALNFQTISSPLATQLPQAAGAAYALKRAGKESVVMCYFGEGAASEGDFHAALNVASTTNCPVIFFCRNNGFAISTPSSEQYKGDGIGGRGPAYGIHTIRVDGNDIFAVFNATKEARRLALEKNRPVVIEAMTYRAGHHSTSDDSSAYRPREEVADWQTKDNPITRVRGYLESMNLWNDELEVEHQKETRAKIVDSFARAEKQPKPPIAELFTDVYDEPTPLLKAQQKEMLEMLAKYPNAYPVGNYATELPDNRHNAVDKKFI